MDISGHYLSSSLMETSYTRYTHLKAYVLVTTINGGRGTNRRILVFNPKLYYFV